jgi:signal transduction histidine kinase
MSSADKPTLSLGVTAQSFPIGSVDARMIGVMRCILALSALLIIVVDPSEPARFVALTYSSILVYFLWAATSVFLASRRSLPQPPRHEHWVDVCFSAFLVALTQGTGSVFFFVFLFAILVASFSRGFAEGLRVTLASVVLFELAILASPTHAAWADLERTVVRPFYLLALGYMIAYWGGHEVTHRRRLRLLQEINNQWNPRFGHDHAIGTNLERALDFFSGAACVLVLKRPTTPPIYLTYHTSGRKRGQAMLPSAITQETAAILLSFPSTLSARYDQTLPWWRRWFPGAGAMSRDGAMAEKCKVLANLLDTTSFLTVPYAQRDGTEGRVYLTAGRRSFEQADVDFFAQLMTTIANVVEGMQLMDELVSRAAEHERYRISLDIHDTTIQPYIGLKLGLDAVAREAGADNPLSPRLGELLGMTENTIRDLRRYMTTLQEDTTLAGDSLVSAVRDQASHYHRFYGIEVDVRCEHELMVSSQVAGATLQIVSEGLSNILRHSKAKQAYVSMEGEGHRLLLDIANECPDAEPGSVPGFTPRSIAARTRSLGGTCVVERDAMGYTIVRIAIPL